MGLGAQRRRVTGFQGPPAPPRGVGEGTVFLSHPRLKPHFRSRTAQWVKLYSR